MEVSVAVSSQGATVCVRAHSRGGCQTMGPQDSWQRE